MSPGESLVEAKRLALAGQARDFGFAQEFDQLVAYVLWLGISLTRVFGRQLCGKRRPRVIPASSYLPSA